LRRRRAGQERIVNRVLRQLVRLSVLVVGLLAAMAAYPGSASAATCTNASIHITSYTLVGPAGLRTVSDMTGQVAQGDVVTVHFTVAANVTGACTISLVSYTAPNGTFNTANLYQQQVYQSSNGPVTPGDWTATVRVPTCYFQADFVRGAPITHFGPTQTNTYSGQGRLLDAAVGGTETCGFDDSPLPAAPPPQEEAIGG
jgi:hypothetical protein